MDFSLISGAKDICSNIFRFLDLKDLLNLLLLNKKFNQLVRESDIWQYYILQVFNLYNLLFSLDTTISIKYDQDIYKQFVGIISDVRNGIIRYYIKDLNEIALRDIYQNMSIIKLTKIIKCCSELDTLFKETNYSEFINLTKFRGISYQKDYLSEIKITFEQKDFSLIFYKQFFTVESESSRTLYYITKTSNINIAWIVNTKFNSYTDDQKKQLNDYLLKLLSILKHS